MGSEVWGVRCEVLFGCVRACDPKYEDCIETYLGALVLIASRYNFSLSSKSLDVTA